MIVLCRWILHDRAERSQTPNHRVEHEPLLRLSQGGRPLGPVLLATRGPGQVSQAQGEGTLASRV